MPPYLHVHWSDVGNVHSRMALSTLPGRRAVEQRLSWEISEIALRSCSPASAFVFLSSGAVGRQNAVITTLVRATSQEELCFHGVRDFSPFSPSWLLRVTWSGISCQLSVGLSSGACSPQQIQTLMIGVVTVFLKDFGDESLGIRPGGATWCRTSHQC